jgi:hypothetical protein
MGPTVDEKEGKERKIISASKQYVSARLDKTNELN